MIKNLVAVDSDNLHWLKGIVEEQGFPTDDEVGISGVSDAWLLVQHADQDADFQSSVLNGLIASLDGSPLKK